MGALLSILRAAGFGSDPNKSFDSAWSSIFVNIDDTNVVSEEKVVYDSVAPIVERTNIYLKGLRDYQDCSAYVRKALSTPDPQLEEQAWIALGPSLTTVQSVYQYIASLESAVTQLLDLLCQGDVLQNIVYYQGCSRLLADVLNFVFEFDKLKMVNPTLLNDITFCRRTAHRMYNSTNPEVRQVLVNEDALVAFAGFFASPNPMLYRVIGSVATYVSNRPDGDKVLQCFALLAAACCNMVNQQKAADKGSVQFCCRTMVTCSILYDHVSQSGMFAKNSDINARTVARTIRDFANGEAEEFMSALRFNTKHLNDESTPKSVKALFN